MISTVVIVLACTAVTCVALWICDKLLRENGKLRFALNNSIENSSFNSMAILRGVPTAFKIKEFDYAIAIYAVKQQGEVLVKQFLKHNDPEYARICAEELLDKLNESA